MVVVNLNMGGGRGAVGGEEAVGTVGARCVVWSRKEGRDGEEGLT